MEIDCMAPCPASRIDCDSWGTRSFAKQLPYLRHIGNTLQILGSPGWEFLAARLKYAGEPIRGDDVRNEITEPDFNAFKARIFNEVRKRIGTLRNLSVDELDQLPRPIGFPDASRFFY